MRKRKNKAVQMMFLIPFYNHPKTIKKLVEILSKFNIDIMIIDDGSDDLSKEVLKSLNASNLNKNLTKNKLMLFTSHQNKGKGSALKIGLELAQNLGYTNAFCLDADMQHDLKNINEFFNTCKNNQSAIICANPIYGTDAPKERLKGRKITNFWVNINTLSKDIKDAMCGMRIYPIKEIMPICKHCSTNAMEFDIEILVRSKRAGLKILWCDAKVTYAKDGISHFKYFKDNLKISLFHARYFLNLPIYLTYKIIGAKYE